MTATPTTFRPPWAVTLWYDAEAIFVELPCGNGQVHIMKFPFHEGGLTKALNLLKTQKAERPLNGKAPKAKEITLFKPMRERPAATVEQRAKAQAVLRKLKMV